MCYIKICDKSVTLGKSWGICLSVEALPVASHMFGKSRPASNVGMVMLMRYLRNLLRSAARKYAVTKENLPRILQGFFNFSLLQLFPLCIYTTTYVTYLSNVFTQQLCTMKKLTKSLLK